jgi:hypothetical protein
MRDHQNISITKHLLDLFDHLQTAPGNYGRQFSSGGRMPGRVGQPTSVIVMVPLIDYFAG